MGLDVYLIERDRQIADNEREAQWEALYAKRESGEITEDEYKAQNDALPKYEPNPDVPSEKYGLEKLFNRRYLRSSYNDSGFNRAVPELIGEEGKDLYWVFEDIVSNEEYSITLTKESIPGLMKAKARALELAEKLSNPDPKLRVETVTALPMVGDAEHLWSKPPTSDEALAWYREQLERDDRDSGWSNAKGTFVGRPGEEDNGFKVLGWVAGMGFLNQPSVHMIYELPESHGMSYAESAEITAEFCDEAISLIDRDGEAHIHWSG